MKARATAAILAITVGVLAPARASASPPGATERLTALGGAFPALSADGRFVAFSTGAPLAADDANETFDIYVLDRFTDVVERASVAAGGGDPDALSSGPVISADGRRIAFWSAASNLVAGDTNGHPDVFVHDRSTAHTDLVSGAPGGAPSNGPVNFKPPQLVAISGDGWAVAFASAASNLVAGDTNGVEDLFVRDLRRGVTRRISVSTDGVQGNNLSLRPSLSADARYVAFQSGASNLVPSDGNSASDAFVVDRAARKIERVSLGINTDDANGQTQDPAISADGRFVAYASNATNLVPGDINTEDGRTSQDVYLFDRVSGETEKVSVAPDGATGTETSGFPSVSADGRFVAFASRAWNFTPLGTNRCYIGEITYLDCYDVFVRDRNTGDTRLISSRPDGTLGVGDSLSPTITPDGRYVAFASAVPDLAGQDENGIADAFLADLGPPVGIGAMSASSSGRLIDVGGWASFAGAAVASAHDPVDAVAGGWEAGAEITRVALSYRPGRRDLLVRLDLANLPRVYGSGGEFCNAVACVSTIDRPGLFGVVYVLQLTVAGSRFEVRATRPAVAPAGNPPRPPVFDAGLYRCTTMCLQEATLSGSLGTTGKRALVLLPLEAIGASGGSMLTNLRAYAGLGYPAAPGLTLDEVYAPSGQVPERELALALAPVGTLEDDLAFDLPAAVADTGIFAATLDLSGSDIPPGDYDIWARACLAGECGAASARVALP